MEVERNQNGIESSWKMAEDAAIEIGQNGGSY